MNDMHTEKIYAAPTVSQLVRADYRLADVFKKWGINYCCGGNLPLADVCRVQNINQAALQTEIDLATKTIAPPHTAQVKQWPVPFLVDYIVHVHHAYLRQAVPSLAQTLSSFVTGHRRKYPYLAEVEATFQRLAHRLLAQAEAEEENFFPYAKRLSNAWQRDESYGALLVRTLRKSLSATDGKEQNAVEGLWLSLRQQTTGYRFAPEACTAHQVIYHKLKAFDDDLVQHLHLENDVLFPKVREMEKALLNS